MDAVTAKARNTELPPGLSYTARRDAWYLQPLLVVTILGAFIAYSMFRMFENAHYHHENLLSPFYSPNLIELLPFVPWDKLFGWLPFVVSPAMLILWAPAGFRFTCYYYRKSYYRSFALDPPGCAVRDPHTKSYRGEARLFLFQNLHRYLLYAATAVVLFLWIDVVLAFIFPDGFGVSLGGLLFLLNAALLTAYSFSCHSLRHIVGGRLDCFSCDFSTRAQYKTWTWVSRLNANHMMWAWVSLFSVAAADLYVRAVSAGWIENVRLI